MRTGLVWDERYMWHNTGTSMGPVGGKRFLEPIQHPENPEGKRRIKNLVELSGLGAHLTPISPRPATEAELLRVHTAGHVERVRDLGERGGETARRFASTPIGPGGFEIAALAAGGVIAAVDAVLDGEVDNAYALVRPPGHHALPDEAMGFCIFANAAIAGRHAIDVRGLGRIAFVDWDVHHGNGTQAVFWREARAFTVSIHQDGAFPPQSGGVDEVGEGEAEGTNLNIPMPPGSGCGAYVAAFERVIVPALRRYRPELIVVPSGFDAGAHDPLGRMMLHSDGYRDLTRRVLEVAAELCGGRVVFCHEGGYSPHSVPFYCLAVLEEMSGRRTRVEDPFLAPMSGLAYQALQAHQDAAIGAAEALVPGIPGQVH